jgi:hypothetical protein
MNNVVTYTAEGLGDFEVRVDGETLWMTQQLLADLFAVDRSVVTKHLRNIFKEEELDKISVCAKFAHTAADGKTYSTQYYSLDAVLSVGYRVNSKRATQFRIWATKVLRDYLLQGAAIRRPATKQELSEVEQGLKRLIDEVRQEMENSEVIADVQFSEIYQALTELLSRRKIEEGVRRKIGF